MTQKKKSWERPVVRRLEMNDEVAEALIDAALKRNEPIPEILSSHLHPEPHYEKRQAGKR